MVDTGFSRFILEEAYWLESNMLMVIFEFKVKSGQSQVYFDLAQDMMDKVENVDGFLGVERFQSCNEEEKYISVSKWRNHKAIKEWGSNIEHRQVQKTGKKEIFDSFDIRVVEVLREKFF